MGDADTPPTVAIIAMGDMGSWIARRLVPRGVAVRTVLAGRTGVSAARAAAAGVVNMRDDDALVAGADAVLSVVPPAAAAALAERLLPALARAARKPVYVDCNAVSRGTVHGIAELLRPAGCPFVDAAIFGSAPAGDGAGPRFYLSGPDAARLGWLPTRGLDATVLDAPVGSASALKCCFAALGKGVAALGTQAALAAGRAGVAEPLQRELGAVFPDLARLLARLIPESFGKAYRWVAEMEEIAADLDGVPGGPEAFRAAASVFAAVTAAGSNRGTEGNMVDMLDGFASGLTPLRP